MELSKWGYAIVTILAALCLFAIGGMLTLTILFKMAVATPPGRHSSVTPASADRYLPIFRVQVPLY